MWLYKKERGSGLGRLMLVARAVGSAALRALRGGLRRAARAPLWAPPRSARSSVGSAALDLVV